ncbi:MAG: hypothetical protein JST70_14570 [Bacteroidetes bacterium]|nr:hypothetical protein [Bacteroidota bacterium]
MNYRYRLSGYTFETNIPIRELIEVNEDPECSLLVRPDISAKIPADALSAESYSNTDLKLTCIQKEQFGFVAIWDNNKIEYTPASHLDEIGITTQLLGTIAMIMSATLGFISLHAASVIINNKAILFCGASGVGKSTLTAHFYSKGYQVLSDDVTTLRIAAPGKILAYPSVPRIKLSDASLALIGKSGNGLQKINFETLKYILPISEIAGGDGYELSTIIFPLYKDGDFVLEQIAGFQNKLLVAQHLYRKKLAKLLYSITSRRELFLALAAHIPMYYFYRPRNTATMRESLDFIESKLNN